MCFTIKYKATTKKTKKYIYIFFYIRKIDKNSNILVGKKVIVMSQYCLFYIFYHMKEKNIISLLRSKKNKFEIFFILKISN